MMPNQQQQQQHGRISVLTDDEYLPPPTPDLKSYKHKKFRLPKEDHVRIQDCQQAKSDSEGDEIKEEEHSPSSALPPVAHVVPRCTSPSLTPFRPFGWFYFVTHPFEMASG